MIDIKALDLSTLPFVAFAEREKLPCKAGVYFLLLDNCPIYIGKTECKGGFRQRMKQHHRQQQFLDDAEITVAWLESDVRGEALVALENAAIAHFDPLLNRASTTQTLKNTLRHRKERSEANKKAKYTFILNRKLRECSPSELNAWAKEVFGCCINTLYLMTNFSTEALYDLAMQNQSSDRPT